jgi:hypothetical protein
MRGETRRQPELDTVPGIEMLAKKIYNSISSFIVRLAVI